MTNQSTQLRSITRWLTVPLVAAFAACGGGSSKSASQSNLLTTSALQAFEITPGSAAAPAGTQLSFTAKARFVDGTTRDVTAQSTWAASKSKLVRMPARGTVVAIGMGTTDITATYSGVSARAALQIDRGIVLSMSVSPASVLLAPGGAQPLAVAAVLSSTTEDVTLVSSWSSSNPGVAIVDGNGLVTAVGNGSAIVTAAYCGAVIHVTVTVTDALANGGTTGGDTTGGGTTGGDTTGGGTTGGGSGSGSITATTIAVAPGYAELTPTATAQLSATIGYSDGSSSHSDANLSWSSSDASVAAVDATGLVTAGTKPGIATITAALSGGPSASASVSVSISLQRIDIAGASSSTPINVPVSFQATGIYSYGNPKTLTSADVSWHSSNEAVATISADGVVNALAEGTTSISAQSKEDSSISSASITLTVDPAVLQAIELDLDGDPAFEVGLSASFKVWGYYSDGLDPKDITSSVTWSLEDPSGALQATARAGLYALVNPTDGATVTVTTPCETTCSDSVTLMVGYGRISGITVTSSEGNSTTQTLVGAPITDQLTATASFDDGFSRDVTSDPALTWSSTVPAVAYFTGNPPGLLTATGRGMTTVLASLLGKTGSMNFVVGNATLIGVSITPASPSWPVLTLNQLDLIGTFLDADGVTTYTYPVTEAAGWSSDNYPIAVVSNIPGSKGSVSTLGIGSAKITASVAGLSASTTVNVINATIQSLIVTDQVFANGSTPPPAAAPFSLSLGANAPKHLWAAGIYSNGLAYDLSRPSRWRISPNTAAWVQKTKNGVWVNPAALGTGTVTARKGPKKNSGSVAFDIGE